ncbi:uncharacterized protein ACBR49_012950 isoform 1-T3 [Aulostomus maculatus]
MDVSWLHLVLVLSVLVSIVLLALNCLDCRNNGPLVSISQVNSTGEYMPSDNFGLIHQLQVTTDLNAVHPPADLPSPFPVSTDPAAHRRQRSFTPTETDSNPSYENPPESTSLGYRQSYNEDYLIVLPGREEPPDNQSRASSPSSDVPHYVNIDNEELANISSEEGEYQNVNPPCSAFQSSGSCGDDDDDDYDEGNYVNQLPMVQAQCMMGEEDVKVY